MDKFVFEGGISLTTIRHRAVCETCGERMPWRTEEFDAETDASKHVKKPGKEDDIVHIFTEETHGRRFDRGF